MDKKKKTLLIVLGVFALTIVTTAVSFAFYTYSRTGTTTTTITSGDIQFSFIEGNDASLTNAFPVSDSVGAQDTTGEYTFDVSMKSSSASNKMTYDVWLLDNNDGTEDYFKNEQIKFALIKNGTYVADTSSTQGVQLSTIDGFSAGSSQGEGLVLEGQEISSDMTDTYKLRIWISDDVNYSNTIDENGTMTGTYNAYKYSLKVKVTSGVSNSIEITEPEMTGRTIVTNIEDENGLSAYAITTSSTAPTNDAEWTTITDDSTASLSGSIANVVRTASSKVTTKTIKHKFDNYGIYYIHVKNALNQVKSKRVNVKVQEIEKDTSGAATPVIKNNLVPVIMNGYDVVKADTTKGWYNYDQSIWANAVILTDDAPTYNNGDLIEEEYIESYFVWIPRYEYKIFDENVGSYTAFTDKGTKKQEIEIQFVNKDTAVKDTEAYNVWYTHPAFTAFDTNGIWVGKFESGYAGATTTAEAQKNVNDKTKLVIKPNVYSWRSIQVANAYQTSLSYETDLVSHMMKNTEWGAVAYLSHSKYGAKDEEGNVGVSLRTNNNRAFITGYSATEEPTLGYNGGTSIPENTNESTALGVDGEYTINYLNTDSVKSSTTGNYSGIYDMAGGAWDYMMAVVVDANGEPLSGRHNVWNSGFQGNYGCPTCTDSGITVDSTQTANTTGVEFPTDTRYFDTYANGSVWNKYNTRILGDATGEMGPFYQEADPDGNTRNKSYWYGDYALFVAPAYPWFLRGGIWHNGSETGAFAFGNTSGDANSSRGFRVVLAP